MADWWADLEKPEPWSTRALLDFSSRPDDTVAFLKEHLKPLKMDQKDLDELLQSLGSDDEKVWKPAFEQLEYFDPRLTEDLATLMQNATEPVGRNHLVEILSGYPPGIIKNSTITLQHPRHSSVFQFKSEGEFSPKVWLVEDTVSKLDSDVSQIHLRKWTRADRAIVLLQHIGTPAAFSILKSMATGNPDARPTIIARVAVESLKDSSK
jgi:hypothetical protein